MPARLTTSSVQVLNNVAQIVLDEMAPGSTAWLKWRNVLHLVDLVCCCSILFPIVWSIRHLRQVRSTVQTSRFGNRHLLSRTTRSNLFSPESRLNEEDHFWWSMTYFSGKWLPKHDDCTNFYFLFFFMAHDF